MAVRNEIPYPPPGFRWVVQNDTLCDIRHVDRGFFPDWHPKVESVKFVNIAMRFQDAPNGDEFYFYMAEVGEGENELDRLVFIVGSEKTGDRLILVNIGTKSPWPGDGILYNRYYFWKKLNPNDDIRIASEETQGESHILDNTRNENMGYQSPFSIKFSLRDDGVIILLPYYNDKSSMGRDKDELRDITPRPRLLL